MGLLDFVKDAGSRIFRDEEEPKKKEESKVDAGKVKLEAEKKMAYALVKAVEKAGLEIEDLEIRFKDHVATVKGKADSQSEKEKVVLVIGNTKGVAQVDDQIEVIAAEPEAVFYTVQPGDSLSKIAKEHYGNAMKYPVIFEANKPMLDNPDKIYPGQVLRIPSLS